MTGKPAMSCSPIVDRFVTTCRESLAAGPARMRELVERAICEPSDLIEALGSRDIPGMRTLYRADDLTILHVVWAPKLNVPPHEHRMWAVIGMCCGCEVNRFWRRAQPIGLRSAGEKTLQAGDAALLEASVIHSVSNPLTRTTGAIHVYGGDFFGVGRSEWASEDAPEQPFDVQRALQRFDRGDDVKR
jgi:predicted metal-dependent enzyme (double-stranded beta helix superfamily)